MSPDLGLRPAMAASSSTSTPAKLFVGECRAHSLEQGSSRCLGSSEPRARPARFSSPTRRQVMSASRGVPARRRGHIRHRDRWRLYISSSWGSSPDRSVQCQGVEVVGAAGAEAEKGQQRVEGRGGGWPWARNTSQSYLVPSTALQGRIFNQGATVRAAAGRPAPPRISIEGGK